MMLADALSRLDYRPAEFRPGHVWLAGAGPGDPGCLTLEVLSAIASADCIVYDALVSEAVLSIAGKAELHFAGKRGGKPSTDQEDITRRLIELARAGKRVLRLKGGDPFIFGRGGEEALALVQAGIPFRILPGLTSGFAGLARAGFPATMRGINKAVILATGHAAGTEEDTDWAALARTGQPIVIYMGLKNLPLIAEALMAGGLGPSTPAAVIEQATTANQRVLVANLGTIVDEASAAAIAAPALIVIGGIVAMRELLQGSA
ncbi:uroporphyrinogen-III C-methyltransferase [Pseudaminobacter sp. 19-2017]|uniref:uroporphyrinogen-III C-methyltransferase n=1 Tax=Pseudaminobacter soli (ex Zhang et al. 2022) TaxID=2831468 RepID=A0A942DXM8_9HYPH|nr:uroporphyrinogen-III C-methyltransferase [Pseudaminobacter soli]MBS3649258.1 uroporphyrinogen-III C-methyltransferase [Pseudaminobacter soli]